MFCNFKTQCLPLFYNPYHPYQGVQMWCTAVFWSDEFENVVKKCLTCLIRVHILSPQLKFKNLWRDQWNKRSKNVCRVRSDIQTPSLLSMLLFYLLKLDEVWMLHGNASVFFCTSFVLVMYSVHVHVANTCTCTWP